MAGWCPVDPFTFESTRAKDVYVIGDAAIAGAMPKSGFAASSQGKFVAKAIAAALNGQPTPGAVFANNFNNFLALIATHFAEKAGQNHGIYQPILEETLSKLRVISPDKAQTGPARRGDKETIERHLGILKAHFPEWQPLYEEFSKRIEKTDWK
jgi:hypothetical protein